ncbi:hypothetical protein HPB49_020340 [Dermacentor silvarum]|uniref:Uncharacterized protein n=1 Tax=Dermacentor silvarum TaxID=543639 RepID=A0ACB8CML7_DERSI|nr:hypothetical protein HPB49_020340 [Dermacentor silvarum]
MAVRYFHVADYCVLVAVLGISSFIGVYFAWKDRRSTNKKDFFGGSRQLQMFPVTMSMMASFMSAIAILGIPAENFLYGSQYMVNFIGIIIASVLAAHVFMPVFYDMEMISVNQHDLRFSEDVHILERRVRNRDHMDDRILHQPGHGSALLQPQIDSQGTHLMPYFVMDTLGHLPGITGLFVTAVYSGSLSTLSSGYNALAAITWEDFLKPMVKLSPKGVMWATKAIAAGFGLIAVAIAFLSGSLPSILSATFVTTGSIKGATCALFFLGLLFPWCGSTTALLSMFTGLAVALWVAVGRLLYPARPTAARTTLEACTWNYTVVVHPHRTYYSGGIYDLYNVSYMWIPVISFFVTLVVAISLTTICGFKKSANVDPSSIAPCMRKIYLKTRTQEKQQPAKEPKHVPMKPEEKPYDRPVELSVITRNGNGYLNHAMTNDDVVERTVI